MFNDKQKWWILVVAALVIVLVYFLRPILTPFLVSALLAYIGDPLADRLEAFKFSRTTSVVIVFIGIMFIILPLPFLLLPLIENQITVLVNKVPGYIDGFQSVVAPWLAERLGLDLAVLDLNEFKAALMQHWQQVGGFAANFAGYLSRSGLALVALLANLVLIPVVTFYLLRDWDVFVGRLRELIPRSVEPTVVKVARDCDEVIGSFVRGQLMVMISLALIYSIGLSLVGLDLALLIGAIAGLVSFVPYLGFIVGMLIAGVAALMQFQDALHLLYVAMVFGFGQLVESFLLTPVLLGDRIGLHPVVVIFAVMAGGQLFGFFGVLLALPVAAVVAVMFRYAHERYVRSELYGSSS